MYLKTIKLAGFKSFVDPTVIPMRSYMNAIVGPNGCGKSNVVDAIRWVIGETSAKQLRGQSMTDVIFNGTTHRKPVGKAAVELIFDNSDARLGGEFAKYNEIAIRREVERDGQSDYYINGTHCRRRDIIDLFLGTGLGPRSYAIIEQGMVSQLIEAKPEDLRVYLEEAAGISKYKERRKETESRIHRTQENLERLTDLREELEKQQKHLKRQATSAERYTEYKQEERLLQAQIKALQWQTLNEKLQLFSDKISEQVLEIERLQTDRQHYETEFEKGRSSQTELSERKDHVQKSFYSMGAEIARIEQEIKHLEEQRRQWQTELIQVTQNHRELSEGFEEHEQQILELSSEVQNLAPQENSIKTQALNSKLELANAQTTVREWEARFEQWQHQYTQSVQKIEVAKTKIEHHQKQLEQQHQRLACLKEQQNDHEIRELSEVIQPLVEQASQLESQLEALLEEQTSVTEQIANQRDVIAHSKVEHEKARHALHIKETELAKLNALQQSALISDDQQTVEWIERHHLSERPRLGKNLQVNSGWELAVETILGHYIEAICVDGIDHYLEANQVFNQGEITLLAKESSPAAHLSTKAKTLSSQIQTDWPVDAWLSGIYIAENLEEAKILRSQLASHESVITPDGIWLGKNWVRIDKAQNNDSSVLLREKAIKTISAEIDEQHLHVEHQANRVQQHEQDFANLENAREMAQRQYQQVSASAAAIQKEYSAKQSRHTQLSEAHARFIREEEDVQRDIQQIEVLQAQIESELAVLIEQSEQQALHKTQLMEERDQHVASLEAIRAKANSDQQRADEFGIRLAANESQLHLLQQTVSRTQRQLDQLSQRQEVLTEQLENSVNPVEEFSHNLQHKLQERVVIENELREAEQALNVHEHRMKEILDARNRVAETLTHLQAELQNVQMEKQAITVRQSTIEEAIAETDFNLPQLIQEMPTDANLKIWEDRAIELAQKITRLGPINLAAIEECQAVTERKDYLDKQQADLEEALSVLQEAIKKIDKETKTKFRETFDKVNTKFQEVFPRIFGGGRASLELTDEDILLTGIIVRAQPPGKKNSTIHMLSGGEKALTAISLIFGLFHLNPAPFCVLDEVDAPLDDVNVGRFCALVKEMSEQTQFIIISHNKVTISSADQLMGVTMQEAGVSRLVSVDVAEALEMVE
jgi:chromosome segregation protein